MLATTHVDKPAGAGLWACDDTDATVSGSGESWISDSGATENMTPDPTGFERYETAPAGRTVQMGDGTLLPVASYRDLRLKIEQDDADCGQTRDLMLRRGTCAGPSTQPALGGATVGDVRASDAAVATGHCF